MYRLYLRRVPLALHIYGACLEKDMHSSALLVYLSMPIPSSPLISTLSLPSTLTPPTSMEANQFFAGESFSCSLRLSFDAESFIEFDPRLMSLRWSIKGQGGEAIGSSLDLDSILLPSLLSRSNRHDSHYFCEAPSLPVPSVSAQSKQINGAVLKHQGLGSSFQKYLWFVVMKFCRRMRGMRLSKRIAGKSAVKAVNGERGRGSKVFDVDSASCIQDAVLHCKNSNLSSLMDEECKSQVSQ